ncbi:MAG: J domain-containing protein [Spirochaetales bacterium]
MRTFWATLCGSLVGLLGGVWGVLIGAGIGFLADLVLVDLRIARACERYLRTGTAPPWLRNEFPIAGAVARVAVGPNLVAERQALLTLLQVTQGEPSGRPSRVAERMLASGASISLSREEIVARLGEARVEQREGALKHVWDFLEETEAPRDAYLRLRQLASQLEVASAFVRNELQVPSRLSLADCKLLGVPRDATLHDVRSAYRALATQFHPDATGGLLEEERKSSEQAFIRIQIAYERLTKELESK